MGRLFGTDGVRGIVGEELTESLARSLGTAAAATLIRRGQAHPRFVIGRDTRASGPALEAAIAEGIRAAGGDVILAGVLPTPAIAFLATDLHAAGVVISASHNPADYNGIKLFADTGYKLPDDVEDQIEAAMNSGEAASDGPGSIEELPDAAERYLEHLTGTGDRLDGLHLVVDCANGAASGVAPEAYRRLGARVDVINDHPDGSNINLRCGALHVDVVAAEVVRDGAAAGIAHDGDADRALFADETGRVVDGDQVLAACALDLHARGLLPEGTIVSTVMANIGFRRAMADAGIRVRTAKVGDRYVLEDMLASGAHLGGEQSGHIIFTDHATTGDGLLTAIRFLSTAVRLGVPVSALADRMRRFPQVMINVRVADRDGLENALDIWSAVGAVEHALGDAGRVLVRASGTEPLVRVMVEASTEEEARAHAEAIAAQVEISLAAG